MLLCIVVKVQNKCVWLWHIRFWMNTSWPLKCCFLHVPNPINLNIQFKGQPIVLSLLYEHCQYLDKFLTHCSFVWPTSFSSIFWIDMLVVCQYFKKYISIDLILTIYFNYSRNMGNHFSNYLKYYKSFKLKEVNIVSKVMV